MVTGASKWGQPAGEDNAMATDDAQTTERPTQAQDQEKPAISDPRDDLRGQVATHRRELQDFFARRQVSQYARRGVKRIFTH
jgi:hypothetical protein